MDDRISVAQVLELGVAVTWQQAVAVTLEAWDAATTAQVRQQPVQLDAESCVLTVTGDVVLSRLATEHRADGALQVLRAMLDGVEAPPELVELAFGASAETLSDDLAQFSRPNRRVEIAEVARSGVAARAAVAPPPAAADPPAAPLPAATALPEPTLPASGTEAFEALRQEAAARPVPPPASQPPARPTPRAPGRGAFVLIAVVFAALTVAAWRLWPSAPAVVTDVETAAPPDVETDPAFAPAPPDPAWSAAGRRDIDIALPRRTAAGARGATSATVVAPGISGDAAPSATAAADVVTSSPMAGPAAANATTDAEATAIDAAIYTWKSAGVEPPSMLHPRMPSAAFPEPGETLDDRPYLEVLVNEGGDVEAVRMRGNLTSFQVVRHGMMMAAAKAWHFTPATRDGQPVRYVVRVLVDQ